MRWMRHKSAVVRCEEAREAISARLDGETSPVSERAIETHLSACGSCREFHALAPSLNRLSLRASKSPPPALTPLLTTQMLQLDRSPAYHSHRAREDGRSSVPKQKRRPRAGVARWAAGLVPAIAVAVVLPLGAAVHTRVVPTRDPTPCTARLHRGVHRPHQPPGRPIT
jgi:anti-sigma factor RsiW